MYRLMQGQQGGTGYTQGGFTSLHRAKPKGGIVDSKNKGIFLGTSYSHFVWCVCVMAFNELCLCDVKQIYCSTQRLA